MFEKQTARRVQRQPGRQHEHDCGIRLDAHLLRADADALSGAAAGRFVRFGVLRARRHGHLVQVARMEAHRRCRGFFQRLDGIDANGPLAQPVQHGLPACAQHVRRGFVRDDEDAANGVAIVAHRRKGISPVGVFHPAVAFDIDQGVPVDGRRLAGQYPFDMRRDGGPAVFPMLGSRLAERQRPAIPVHPGGICVVVDLTEILAPPDHHRFRRIEHERHQRAQAGGPGGAWSQRRSAPVETIDQGAHRRRGPGRRRERRNTRLRR